MTRRIMLLAAFVLSCTAPSREQVLGVNHPDSSELDRFPYVNLSDAAAASQSAETPAKEEERARRLDAPGAPVIFDKENPQKSGRVHYLPRYDYFGNIDPFHIDESDVIAIGTVEPTGSHLTKGGGFIYSTYSFSPTQLLKGTLGGRGIALERKGGVVLLPDGKKRFVGVYNFGLPEAGYEYVLFLKATPDKHSFEIIGGFALLGSSVMSLDIEGNRYNKLDQSTLISAIRGKIATN